MSYKVTFDNLTSTHLQLLNRNTCYAPDSNSYSLDYFYVNKVVCKHNIWPCFHPSNFPKSAYQKLELPIPQDKALSFVTNMHPLTNIERCSQNETKKVYTEIKLFKICILILVLKRWWLPVAEIGRRCFDW